ncbi:MAG: aminomethyltransferase family protein [Blastocatellia bacterium]
MEPTTSSPLIPSPLLEAEKRLNARFGNFCGWEMARSFGDSVEEHRTVRQHAGLINLSYYGVVRVSGKEAAQFLNGLVTNDVKGLQNGQGMRAAFLTGHGKVRALCRILKRQDCYLIINDSKTHEKIFKYIFPFSYAGDFHVEDVSSQFRALSIQGPQAAAVFKEISFEPLPEVAEYHWAETLIGGHSVLVVRTSHTGEVGFDVLVSESGLNDVWDFILMKGAFHRLAPIGLEALNSLRIEAGIPIYGVDVDESNMMLELGLQDAVSFTKGCYTGQEAVAMATYRGHISKRLSGLLIEGEQIPEAGSKVVKGEKEIGLVTSAIRSISLNTVIALAYVKYGFFDSGNEIQIHHAGKILKARVTDLPFYRSESA